MSESKLQGVSDKIETEPQAEAQNVMGTNGDRLLRLPEVVRMTGLSKNTIYRYMDAGIFPHSVRLGPNAVGWRESEVQQWIAERARNIGVSGRASSALMTP